MLLKLIVVPLLAAVAVAPEPPPPMIVTTGFPVYREQRLLLGPPKFTQLKLPIDTSFRSVTWPVAPKPTPPVILSDGGDVYPVPLAPSAREAIEPCPTPTHGPLPLAVSPLTVSPLTCLIAGVVSGYTVSGDTAS